MKASDRDSFRRDLLKLFFDIGVGVADPDASMLLLCSHSADFDPASNGLWEDVANQSAVRLDVHCWNCNHTVAMSNGLYEKFLGFDKKPRICCSRCVVPLLTEGK